MYFYLPQLGIKKLPYPASSHLASMRVQTGDVIFATDLNGKKAKLKIVDFNKKKKEYKFEKIDLEYILPVKEKKVLIQSITDKNYIDKMLEVVPLAGITDVVLFVSDFSPRQNLNKERLEKIIIRSCEQAELIYKPSLTFSENSLEEIVKKYYPVILDSNIVQDEDKNREKDDFNSVLVGCEGGWSERELDICKKYNLQFQSLGGVVYPAWIAGYTWFSMMKMESR